MTKISMLHRTRRRLGHHLGFLLVASSSCIGLYMIGLQKTTLANISLATGYVSLGFLAIALSIGPVRVLRRRNSPPSIDIRRDISIWSAVVGIIHSIVGLQVHFNGQMHLYFIFPSEWNRIIPIRYDAFGVANHTGLLAVIILAYLLFLSNDWSVRRIGVKAWKARQRLAYFAAAFTGLHMIVYQFLEGRDLTMVAVATALTLVVVALQLSGRTYKLGKRSHKKVES